MTIASGFPLVVSATSLLNEPKQCTRATPTIVPRSSRKSVRFDDYDDLYVYERQHDASQKGELWWSKAELHALRVKERSLVRSDANMLRYLQVVTRSQQHVSCQQSPLSSNDMQALVETLSCGRYRGLEVLVPSTEHAERSARVHETVASIVSVYRRARKLVETQSNSRRSAASAAGNATQARDRGFDLNDSDHSDSSTSTTSTAMSMNSSMSSMNSRNASSTLHQSGADSIARMVRSHAVALTHRHQQWAQTLAWADYCAVTMP